MRRVAEQRVAPRRGGEEGEGGGKGCGCEERRPSGAGAKAGRRCGGGGRAAKDLGRRGPRSSGGESAGGVGEEVGGGRPPTICLYNNYITTILQLYNNLYYNLYYIDHY